MFTLLFGTKYLQVKIDNFMEYIFRYRLIALFFGIAILIASCDADSEHYELFTTMYYSSIEKELPLCILLVDLSCYDEESIKEDYSNLLDKCIFKVVDTNLKVNQWYLKWLGSNEQPLLCCFSSKGDLLDVILGIPDSYIVEQVIKGGLQLNIERENSFLKDNPERLLFLDKVVKNQLFIEAGIDMGEESDDISTMMSYPYVYYQSLLSALLVGDMLRAKIASYNLLDFEGVERYSKLYMDEFNIARYILGINKVGPHIKADRDIIEIKNLKRGASNEISVQISNNGFGQLLVYKVAISCSCISISNRDQRFLIDSGKSHNLVFTVTPDDSESALREIVIFSNAVNNPVLKLQFFIN